MNLILSPEVQALLSDAVIFRKQEYFLKAQQVLLHIQDIYWDTLPFVKRVQLLVDLGDVFTAQKNFKSAAWIFEQAMALLAIDGGSLAMVDALLGRARLFTSMKEDALAEKDLLACVEILEENTDGSGKLAVVNKFLADLYAKSSRFDYARTYYERSGLAPAIVAHGVLEYNAHNWEKALTLFLQGKELVRLTADTEPATYTRTTALLSGCLLTLYTDMKDEEAARKAHRDLLKLEVSLRNGELSLSEPARAAIHSEVLLIMASWYFQKNDEDAAAAGYSRAIENYNRLEQINPGTYLPVLAEVLHSLGTLYRNCGRLRDAENTYKQSIVIKQRLADEYPDIYEPVLARNFHSLSRLYMKMDDAWQASVALKSTALVFERLANKMPEQYEDELLKANLQLGMVLYRNRDRRGARAIWEKTLPIAERLVEKDPARYESELLTLMDQVAGVHIQYGQLVEAEKLYRREIVFKEEYRSVNPNTYYNDMAGIYRHIGQVYVEQGALPEAEAMFVQAISWYEAAAEKEGTDVAAGLMKAMKQLEDIYAKTAGLDPSVSFLLKQLSIYERQEVLQPGLHRGKIADVLTSLASEYADDDKDDDAESARLRAGVIYEQLMNEGHPAYGPLLADNFFWLAILYDQKGNPAADMAYRRSLDLYEQIVTQDNADFNIKYANVLMYYGRFLIRQGQVAAAKHHVDKAIMLARNFSKDEQAEAILAEGRGR